MFRSVIGLIVLTCLTLAAAQPALAGTICQGEISAYLQIFANAPIGQTFTAEDEQVSRFAFNFDDFNNELFNGSTIVRLYQGDTIAGVPIYVDAVEITPGSQGLVFFNILPVPLTIGATYTFEVERFNPRWGLGVYQHQFSDGEPIPGHEDYSGGHAIINGQPALGYDLGFLVTSFVPIDGDGNGDGWVDGLDYLVWAANFGTHQQPNCDFNEGDYNYDGWTDGLDYLLWVTNLGNHTATSVPEPGACLLMLTGLGGIIAVVGRRRTHPTWPASV